MPFQGGNNNAVFGQAMKKKKGRSNYQRQFGGGKSATVYRSASSTTSDAEAAAQKRRQRQILGEQIDAKMGVERFSAKNQQHEMMSADDTVSMRRGWLYNIMSTTVTAAEDATTASSGASERAGVDLYFIGEAGGSPFKTTLLYRPYFYVLPDLTTVPDSQQEVILEMLTSIISRLGEGSLHSVEVVHLMDLDQPNHLAPRNAKGCPAFKLIFDSVSQLTAMRQIVREVIEENEKKATAVPTFEVEETNAYMDDPKKLLADLREYDVPYVVRVCTDLDVRAGTWYDVELLDSHHDTDDNGGVRLLNPDRESKADPTFLAFDIECTKPPLKFPNAENDEIYMISYMVRTPEGGRGFLITSRSVVSTDISDFDYSPSPNYPGPFEIFNEKDEKSLIERFFQEYRRWHPQIVVTYNGDFFDWPFLMTRAKVHGMDMYQETGVLQLGEEFSGRTSVHLDAFHWVQRDSYLPQGSQGLKAVTKYKLGYDPTEVDPEDMVKFARERPEHMANYSVSDAVATYYLYEKYVHLFIFSLATIIPMGPEDVLRKGSGTLCEALLMVQAFENTIVCPNKQTDGDARFFKGHLLESETYIGGKVECLETGVYRSDVEYDFDLKPEAFQQLIDNIDRDLTFSIEVEGDQKREDVVNYNEIRGEIVKSLEALRDNPKRVEKPFIYHLDVGAMYPNIILSNRLQPSAIVDDATCAACEFNQEKNGCKRRMEWIWRGDYSPANRLEYERALDQLSREKHRDGLSFQDLDASERKTLAVDRLKEYSRKAYQKTKITEEVARKDIVCMREHDFYVGTVRQFRDRRNEFKKLTKTWKRRLLSATGASKKDCEDRVLVYDSLQVAHKCILNSFYGYVMRKGARWRSMEMAGIVTKTGADIITQARILVEQIGRPLELDTDGIWCILPHSFPDVYTFHTKSGSQLKLEYPCVMLNADVHNKFTNHQYQTLVDPERGIYESHSECSIFFEVDGPYRCMVLPASTEEGKLLKKRYAVFNFDGTLAELKGFELKRRGELELIKTFQSQVFERFLDGGSLDECYDSVAEVANHWIDVIDTRGESLDDNELVDLISENRNMSRQLDDYGDQKGTSQTTARRLGEFLGAEIVKDKGLNCKFIIAEQPYGAPVTERAIPTAIWKAEPSVMKHYLRKWLKAPGLDGESLDIRNVLDWEYYLDRLGKTIQKIITIPAALQKVENPVPRVPHPEWLSSKVSQLNDSFQQQSLMAAFKKQAQKGGSALTNDIEDVGNPGTTTKRAVVRHRGRKQSKPSSEQVDTEEKAVERVILSKNTFGTWLERKKVLWRRSRMDKGPLRDTLHGKRQKKAMSVESFVKEAALSRAQEDWQIVEVRELTTFDASLSGTGGSGDLALWVFVGKGSLQKIQVTVPKVVYVSTKVPIDSTSSGVTLRRVDRHLPRGRTANHLYEVTMEEYQFRTKKWTEAIKPVQGNCQVEGILETIYESSSSAVDRALSALGSMCRLKPESQRSNARKGYMLNDLTRVDRQDGMEYLHSELPYKRIFLYNRVNARTKTGLIAVYSIESNDEDIDITRPTESSPRTVNLGATCYLWVVKPGSSRAQRTVSLKQCETLFSQLTTTIQEEAGLDSDYACVSSTTLVSVARLNFADSETVALAGANEIINSVSKSNQGPSIVMVNTSKPTLYLRRYMSSLANIPVVLLSFPPGPAHNPELNTMPALNWEQPMIQLCFEAYLFMSVISFPKRVSYSRYGQVPLGNLGKDENVATFEVNLGRLVEKNRALSWASRSSCGPDLGVDFASTSFSGSHPHVERGSFISNQDEIWGDVDDLVSPVVRRPGCYRSICVDIDVHDLAIAALTDLSSSVSSASVGFSSQSGPKPRSPASVTMFDGGFGGSKASGPLGDEMSTTVSLPILRALVCGWLRDALNSNSLVADELLHHVYRLISMPQSCYYDPALHRVVHTLMKRSFLRMLGELQVLGCSIIFASFHKIIVATDKLELADAEEYVNFVIATARKRAAEQSEQGDALSRVALRPRQYHTHFLFLDEYNYGTIQLNRVESFDLETGDQFVIPEGGDKSTVVVPSVITAWSVMNYLGSEQAQEYFRALIGRFSREVFRKQMEIVSGDRTLSQACLDESRLVEFTKKMLKKNFASHLTRALGEILNGSNDELVTPPMHDGSLVVPALEFIKNITRVLELDKDVEVQVQILRRSLLAQIGVAEYAEAARWKNPCPKFILPDVFCAECHECRDANLCHVPVHDEDEDDDKDWVCEDCGTPYDVADIQNRLVHWIQRKMVRYQLQDLRCTKTNRVATRVLTALSDSSASLKLDVDPHVAEGEVLLLDRLAKYHNLEKLEELTGGILTGYSGP